MYTIYVEYILCYIVYAALSTLLGVYYRWVHCVWFAKNLCVIGMKSNNVMIK